MVTTGRAGLLVPLRGGDVAVLFSIFLLDTRYQFMQRADNADCRMMTEVV